jgi:3-isopropylmalate dehydratase small subunit
MSHAFAAAKTADYFELGPLRRERAASLADDDCGAIRRPPSALPLDVITGPAAFSKAEPDVRQRQTSDLLRREPRWRGATFLVVDAEVGGCWDDLRTVRGLADLGVRGLIGPSFAPCFDELCAAQGLLAATLDEVTTGLLAVVVSSPVRNALTVDLPGQTIETSFGNIASFTISTACKRMLLWG